MPTNKRKGPPRPPRPWNPYDKPGESFEEQLVRRARHDVARYKYQIAAAKWKIEAAQRPGRSRNAIARAVAHERQQIRRAEVNLRREQGDLKVALKALGAERKTPGAGFRILSAAHVKATRPPPTTPGGLSGSTVPAALASRIGSGRKAAATRTSAATARRRAAARKGAETRRRKARIGSRGGTTTRIDSSGRAH